jgi:hypothetical protein
MCPPQRDKPRKEHTAEPNCRGEAGTTRTAVARDAPALFLAGS